MIRNKTFILDEKSEKSILESKEPVSGTLIQHELNFFEFETKMRKIINQI